MRGTNDELGDSDEMYNESLANYDGANCEEILGTTKVAQGHRISIVVGVQEAFADRGIEIEEGDRLVYKLRDGHVVIELA